MPATVAEFNIEIDRQQKIYELEAERRKEEIRQGEIYEKERKEKLRLDIKRAREQQVAELLARKKKAK